MIDAALVASAALMGIAGAPHCAAMCGAACGAVVRGCSAGRPGAGFGAFLAGRLAGYATAGAVAASAVAMLSSLGSSIVALHALWTLVHAGAFALGLWLAITARQPAWMSRIGTSPVVAATASSGGWQRIAGPVRTSAAGAAWVALPCGLLQSALVIASLADRPLTGAAPMAAFAITSSTGLALVPAVAFPWASGRLARIKSSGWAVRAAGIALAAASGWALGHGLWQRVVALCT
jgi:hypothetical protein